MNITPIQRYALAFLAAVPEGMIAKQDTKGLSVFSPLPGREPRAFLVQKGKELAGAGRPKLHVLSVKVDKKNPEGPQDKFSWLKCNDLKPAPTRSWSHWWSVAMLEYSNEEDMNKAIENLNGHLPKTTSVKALKTLAEELAKSTNAEQQKIGKAALRTLKALADVREGEDKEIPEFRNSLPLAYNLDNAAILYHQSGSQDDENALWTNTQNNKGGQNTAKTSSQEDANLMGFATGGAFADTE